MNSKFKNNTFKIQNKEEIQKELRKLGFKTCGLRKSINKLLDIKFETSFENQLPRPIGFQIFDPDEFEEFGNEIESIKTPEKILVIVHYDKYNHFPLDKYSWLSFWLDAESWSMYVYNIDENGECKLLYDDEDCFRSYLRSIGADTKEKEQLAVDNFY